MEIITTSRTTIPEIPSLSGVEIINDSLFLVSDNLPELFETDFNGKIKRKIRLIPKTEFEGGLMPKHLKPDFEAMCKVKFINENRIFIFGSGSKSPQRDWLFIIDPTKKDSVKKYSLFEFYSQIRIACSISADDLNIEAAVAYQDKILLFNRGVNLIIEFTIEDLFQHFENKKYTPEFTFYTIYLPVIKYIQAGFSGADIIEDKIIFTASVENTFNWIDDGEILGSYIGFISLKNLKNNYTPPCKLITENGIPLKVKVESVVVKSVSQGKSELILVTDSDGGSSEIIYCTLN